MFRKPFSFFLVLTLALLYACSQEPQLDTSNFAFSGDNGSITLPEGFRAIVVADSLGYGRHIAVDDDGDLYMALREKTDGHGIVALRDTTGDGVADVKEFFGEYAGTGIALHGGYLYFAPETQILRYSMEGVDLVPTSEPEVVVSGFPDQNQHATKTITFDGNGNIYVNVGAPSNACQEETRTPESPGQDPCPQLERQAGIWRFDADSLGQTQQADGYRYATGIRNAVALKWNQGEDQLYLLQHGRDQLSQLWREYYTNRDNAELPSEEFFKVDDGDNFGWPYAYYDHRRGEKMLAPEYGGDGETPATQRSDEYEDPIMAFPGHWAPNDLVFYSKRQFPRRYRDGAFIAFHGSWNRAPLPQQGYKVVFVPFDGDDPAGDYETFADGFAGSDSLLAPNQAEYRPSGLAEGPNGTLYITDSVEGRVWRVVYTGTD